MKRVLLTLIACLIGQTTFATPTNVEHRASPGKVTQTLAIDKIADARLIFSKAGAAQNDHLKFGESFSCIAYFPSDYRGISTDMRPNAFRFHPKDNDVTGAMVTAADFWTDEGSVSGRMSRRFDPIKNTYIGSGLMDLEGIGFGVRTLSNGDLIVEVVPFDKSIVEILFRGNQIPISISFPGYKPLEYDICRVKWN